MPLIKRLRALDLFRGLTVVGMILVNSSGSDDVFRVMDHAPWNGLTFADFVFPSFLMIVGVSAAFSHASRRARGQTEADIARHAAVRAVGLFGLGLLVNFVVFREAGGIRWPGVLQRIALCSLGATGFLLLDRPALEPFAAAALLGGYWLLMTRVPVPGHGAGVLTPEGNLASWLDRRLMAGHLLTPLEDQEGLLSTAPAFATTLLGVIAGRRLAADGAHAPLARTIGAWGLALAALGSAWSLSFPLNKHLWTSSYALVTGGLCLAGLALFILFTGERPVAWEAPLESLGRRALTAYVGAGFVYGVLEFVGARLPDGSRGNLKLWLNAHLFASWLPPRVASLAFAIVFTALAAAAVRVYDRRWAFRPISS
ncbi:MAG TPA: heparan-alpha-glucosaminide N-acetyltransferase domain-containing protein [Elusimicrobiota bacterium]|nr:heparan-alpha-glucosaminide N-acetyltransferase domain-containing protein [Elusimicrobiota bacterium]